MTTVEKIDELRSFIGKEINCGTLFEAICVGNQWKYDLEESDLMCFFSRTWIKEGYKAMIFLEDFICAPPYHEEECIQSIVVTKIDPAKLIDKHKRTGDDPDDPSYYHAHYGDFNFSVVFDDPEWEDKLIPFEELPEFILNDLHAELSDAIK